MLIAGFMGKVIAVHKTGAATEHSYRPALEGLFNSLSPSVTAINEPKRVKCGAPDFIMQRGDLVIGHAEAKDLNLDIHSLKDANKDQQQRYLKALPNLIYTNCLDWDFFRNGEKFATVNIGKMTLGIKPNPDEYDRLENLLLDFAVQKPQTITSPRDLATRMAGKANLIKDVLRKTLADDKTFQSELFVQYAAFKENLIHDITPEDFSDIYAETVAYGMFAARLHDTTLETFTRQEALELLPKSNPFLRSLFGYVAGHDLDDRIAWIIDDLAGVFQAVDISKVMAGFGKLTGQADPFLHFYETFLAAYNPSKRKARGVWYTPEPVVNFIVRAVDEVLQGDFGLEDGLADTSKVTINWDTGQRKRTQKGGFSKDGKNQIEKREVHRVQILDPATGTGTFLAEVIKQIAPKVQGVAPGIWSKYIADDLVPRLHGFELLMASYAMCHMKIDMILTELGYKPDVGSPRLSVYLTNSLEEGEPANQTLPFTQWLSREAKGANTIKRDMPIMCVIGNPPYSVASSNKGEWANALVAPYKADLDETSMNSLSDDYVKFIRLAENFVSANEVGMFGMITNNSFLDGVVHRKMRLHLRRTFDDIYIVNLHGDSNKKERTPEGQPDRNVFDIMQGVAITIAIKTGKKEGLADVRVKDIWGSRQSKYDYLTANSLKSIDFQEANFHGDYHFFTRKDFAGVENYEAGFKINDLFQSGLSGIKFRKDRLLVLGNHTRADAVRMADDVATMAKGELLKKYGFSETSDWQLDEQRQNFQDHQASDFIKIAYRPLDWRWTYYPLDKIHKIIPRGDSRRGLMQHMIGHKNIALICGRQNKSGLNDHFLVSDCPSEMKTGESTIQSYHFPLYLYPTGHDLDRERRVNFSPNIFKRIQSLGKDKEHGIPDELQVFDYIYAVLYSPSYRQTYAEFLRIDFPRIPYPASSQEFWTLSTKGAQLRKLHLMDATSIGATPYPLQGEGNNVVEGPKLEGGKIWINKTQGFDAVPEVAWDFFIGGYQPAQRWLKDRRGRALHFDEVKHFQRIIKVLTETDRIMNSMN
ncbi:MAG: DNA methyltransferase [Ancylobacter novellus]|uniref:site-specific DNA-methyltransferase (adenine-specific) n=1 Tax=Ancylobacter novellus TaxID=921 RepID=A0A2W5T1T9_ANCNO|nr:MAG: DNA methyltransferase [Ancylobacter novellus]